MKKKIENTVMINCIVPLERAKSNEQINKMRFFIFIFFLDTLTHSNDGSPFEF